MKWVRTFAFVFNMGPYSQMKMTSESCMGTRANNVGSYDMLSDQMFNYLYEQGEHLEQSIPTNSCVAIPRRLLARANSRVTCPVFEPTGSAVANAASPAIPI